MSQETLTQSEDTFIPAELTVDGETSQVRLGVKKSKNFEMTEGRVASLEKARAALRVKRAEINRLKVDHQTALAAGDDELAESIWEKIKPLIARKTKKVTVSLDPEGDELREVLAEQKEQLIEQELPVKRTRKPRAPKRKLTTVMENIKVDELDLTPVQTDIIPSEAEAAALREMGIVF